MSKNFLHPLPLKFRSTIYVESAEIQLDFECPFSILLKLSKKHLFDMEIIIIQPFNNEHVFIWSQCKVVSTNS